MRGFSFGVKVISFRKILMTKIDFFFPIIFLSENLTPTNTLKELNYLTIVLDFMSEIIIYTPFISYYMTV